jgi:hypothetical protein
MRVRGGNLLAPSEAPTSGQHLGDFHELDALDFPTFSHTYSVTHPLCTRQFTTYRPLVYPRLSAVHFPSTKDAKLQFYNCFASFFSNRLYSFQYLYGLYG